MHWISPTDTVNQLGMSDCQAVERLRIRRPGALFNECVASYLHSL